MRIHEINKHNSGVLWINKITFKSMQKITQNAETLASNLPILLLREPQNTAKNNAMLPTINDLVAGDDNFINLGWINPNNDPNLMKYLNSLTDSKQKLESIRSQLKLK